MERELNDGIIRVALDSWIQAERFFDGPLRGFTAPFDGDSGLEMC